MVLDRSHPLASGLIGAFITIPGAGAMADLTGQRTPITDSSSNGIGDGIISSLSRQAVEFDGGGSNDRIDLGSVTSSDPLGFFGKTTCSILSWARFDNSTTTYPRAIDKSNGGVGANGWTFGSVNSGGAELAFYTGGSGAAHAFPGYFTVNDQMLIGYTLNGLSSGTAYKDGVLFGTSSNTIAAFPSTTTNCAIGNWNHSTGRMWDGAIYSVLVYDRVLSADDHAMAYDPATRWAWLEQYGRVSYFIPEAAAPGGFQPAWATRSTVTVQTGFGL